MRDDTLLQLRATDAGFDRSLPPEGEWLCFAAAGSIVRLWLAGDGRHHLVAASPSAVTEEVEPLYGITPWAGAVPVGANSAWVCVGDAALDALCRRLAVLGTVLPDQPLQRFEAKVALAVEADRERGHTERIAEVRQRVGQSEFRDALLGYWGGRCPISGVTEPALLRASHAKPWREATDAERLDVHNGLLLAAHLDAAFDQGLIAVDPSGVVLVARRLGQPERRALGLDGAPPRIQLSDRHLPYLAWHRQQLFAPNA
jgi:hypothetical protein